MSWAESLVVKSARFTLSGTSMSDSEVAAVEDMTAQMFKTVAFRFYVIGFVSATVLSAVCWAVAMVVALR